MINFKNEREKIKKYILNNYKTSLQTATILTSYIKKIIEHNITTREQLEQEITKFPQHIKNRFRKAFEILQEYQNKKTTPILKLNKEKITINDNKATMSLATAIEIVTNPYMSKKYPKIYNKIIQGKFEVK